MQKNHACDNNPEGSSTAKINKHTACGCSLFTHCSFNNSKSKHDFYRGVDFMQILKHHATEIINYEKKSRNVALDRYRD